MKKFVTKLLAIMMIVVMLTIPTIALADSGMMKTQTIAWAEALAVVETVGILAAGFVVSYFKTSTKFRGFIAQLIADAEVKYAYAEKAGKQKMNWVIEQLYSIIPAPIKLLFSEERLRAFVQEVFESISEYAKIQCDRAVDALQAKYNAAKLNEPNKSKSEKG